MSTIFRKMNETDRNVEASLYIGNIDPKVNETLLYELFIQFAPVRSLNLPKDRVLRSHQGFGFIEFRDEKDTDYILQILKGVRLYGKLLKLRKLEAGRSTTSTAKKPTQTIDVGAKIFINNLHPLIDEKFLNDTFSDFGNIISTPVVVRDNDTGESKGHGFISFEDFESSDKAIEALDGKLLMNTKISVTYAYKEGTNLKVKHGDKAERLLAENAKKNLKKK